MLSDLQVQMRKDINGLFQEAIAVPPTLQLMSSIATVVPSTSNKEDYSWLDEVQGLSEFDDEVIFAPLSDTLTPYEAINVLYTGGLSFSRSDLADDKVGGAKLRVADLMRRGFMHPDEQIAAVLTANPTGLHAESLFSATHAARGDSGTQSNLLTGSGTSTAQVATDVGLGIAKLYTLLDYAGKPFNRGYKQFAVIYPPSLNKQVMEAVMSPIVAQTSNTQFSSLSVVPICEPLLEATSAADFYIAVMDAPVRGVIFQAREGLSAEAQESEASDDAFKREIYNYKVRYRGVAKAGQWKRIVMINNT